MLPRYRKIFFFSVMALYLAVPGYLIGRYEMVISAGTVYKFRPVPVDPLDYLRGRYVTLSFDNNYVEGDSTLLQYKQDVYVTLRKDRQGFARYTGVLWEAPDKGDYFKTTVQTVSNDSGRYRLYFDIPMEQFFLNEKIAPEVERQYNALAKDSALVLEASVRGGHIVPRELLLNGKPVGKR